MTEAGAGRTQLSTTCDSGSIMVSEHRVGNGEWGVEFVGWGQRQLWRSMVRVVRNRKATCRALKENVPKRSGAIRS